MRLSTHTVFALAALAACAFIYFALDTLAVAMGAI